MHINWNWPGWTWLLHTAELAGLAFAATIYAAWQASPSPDFLSIPWAQALSHGGYAAVGVIVYAIASLAVKNGTASFLPNVVAKPRDTASGSE